MWYLFKSKKKSTVKAVHGSVKVGQYMSSKCEKILCNIKKKKHNKTHLIWCKIFGIQVMVWHFINFNNHLVPMSQTVF